MQKEARERIPAIIGLGKAVGRNIVDNAQIAANLGKDPLVIDRLMKPVGIKSRNWVEKGEQVTSDLCTEALLQALAMADVERNSLRTIVVATSSPDYMGVPAAPIVQHKLGLSTNVRGYDITAACTGWVHALYNTFKDLSASYAYGEDTGPHAVIGAEILSLILSKKQPLLYPLFGDAAGATLVDVVQPDEGVPTNWQFAFGVDGKYAESLYMPAGGSKFPACQATVDADMHTLMMDGRVVKEHAVNQMATLTKQVLEKAGVPQEEVTLLIPHQANLDIIRDTAEALNFPMEKVIVVIDHMGNTSAASIPTAITEAWESGRLQRNNMVAFATFGAGFEFAAGVIPMVGLPKK